MKRIVISLGSNIDREAKIRFALVCLERQFPDIEISRIFETRPVGFDGPDFFNLVAGFVSDQSYEEVREILKDIEKQAGREAGAKSYGSRVLDIDILLFGDQVLQPDFNVPRDEILKFAYVLQPLAELYPDMLHPETGQRFADMWSGFCDPEQQTAAVVIDLSPSRASA